MTGGVTLWHVSTIKTTVVGALEMGCCSDKMVVASGGTADSLMQLDI